MGSIDVKPKGRLLVVGAGFAGLGAAVELQRKGFEVEVIESVKQLSTQGMEISSEA